MVQVTHLLVIFPVALLLLPAHSVQEVQVVLQVDMVLVLGWDKLKFNVVTMLKNTLSIQITTFKP